jgi:uncharacterized protein (TIGR03437 family)
VVNTKPRLAFLLGIFFAGALLGQTVRRPLAVNQSRYRAVAGGRILIEAPSESVTFMLSAKTRVARAASGSFAVAPNLAGNQVLVGIPLATKPGDYSVSVSFTNETGEERSTTLQVAVAPLERPAAGSAVPAVVLLDGWQPPVPGTSCPMAADSSGTFGNLESYLRGSPNSVPAVYFFENCTECPSCGIEQLGADLGTFINSLRYSDGTEVTQVDVIAHSMGGLIVRSYLAGKQQTAGAFSPPSTPKIRKAVFLATPHFGSFQANNPLATLIFGQSAQTMEMQSGSQFLWDLARWNQFGDDLRGVDAIAVIGNAGSMGALPRASDGIVDLISGSLDFAEPGRTRIVNYCHIPLSGLEASFVGCTGAGIAYIDSTAHQAYQIVSSFLAGTSAWQNIGTAPGQNTYLSKDGGIIVADVGANNQYINLSTVSWGSVALAAGSVGTALNLFYTNFVSGTESFLFGSSTCGPYALPAGIYATVRCKSAPAISSVGPLLGGAAKAVQSGTTITIAGTGFGAEQCGGCLVTASDPQSSTLQISSWSDTSIQAVLPARFNGIARITVTTETGVDAINIMAAPLVSGPQVPPGSVVGAGLSTPVVTALSSNAIATVFGLDFAPAGTAKQVGTSDLENGQLPTAVNGVCVYVDGVAAPIFALYPNQINFQVPAVASSGTVNVRVASGCGTAGELRSASEAVPVAAATPEFFYFVFRSDGKNPIAAVNAVSGDFIGSANLIPGSTFVPALAGDVLTLYFTGGGATVPAFAPGELPNGQATVSGAYGISIGGVQLTQDDILYVGVSPQFAGLYQANIQVPEGVQPGNQPVILTIAGNASPAGYLLIGPGAN